MSKVNKDEINRLLTESNNKQNTEYIIEAAEQMSTKESSSFWRQLAAAVIVDAIPHIPSIADNVCKLVVPGYVGSREQQALAFGMEVKGTTDKYEEINDIKISTPSAIASVIAHHPKEVNNIIKGVKSIAKDAAYTAQQAVTNSLGGRLVAGVWNTAVEIGLSIGKHVVSEVRADQKTLSSSDRKHLRQHRSRHADAPVHKSGGRGH